MPSAPAKIVNEALLWQRLTGQVQAPAALRV